MELSMIFATSDNGVIGKDNKLLWNLPNDLKMFKKLTSNKVVIMGRKTFESLPNGALPNRLNIVLCNDNASFKPINALVFNKIESVLEYIKNYDECFIIGGGMIYKLFLPYVSKIYMTSVHTNIDGDTYAPEIFNYKLEILEHKDYYKDEKHEYDYSFTIFKKID